MTANCYRCSTALIPKENASALAIKNEKYQSEEHIIPNVLGGQIKSKRLLCKKCNNILAKRLETNLQSQLFLAKLIPIKQERGKQKPAYILGLTEKKRIPVLVNMNLEWTHYKNREVEFSEQGKIISIRAKDVFHARQILDRLKIKNQNIDVEEILKSFNWSNEYLTDSVVFDNHSIGGTKLFKAIAKIAINFFLYNGGKSSDIKDIIDYACKLRTKNRFVTYHYSWYPFHKLNKNEISHILYLRGNNKYNLLYCYIELFNVANFIVILDRNYNGLNFERKYCYDLLKSKELKRKKLSINLPFDPFDRLSNRDYANKEHSDTSEYLKEKFTRFLAIVEKINDIENINRNDKQK